MNYGKVDVDSLMIAISFVESVMNQDDEQQTLIRETVDDMALMKGLVFLAYNFLEHASTCFNVSREEVVKALRQVTLQMVTDQGS